jgi:hypothetical protein
MRASSLRRALLLAGSMSLAVAPAAATGSAGPEVLAAPAAGIPGGAWWERTLARVEAAELAIAPDASGAWTAHVRAAGVRAAGVRAHWADGVLGLEPRTQPAGWRLAQRFAGIARAGQEPGAAPPVLGVTVSGGHLAWDRGAVTERYLVDSRGIEQAFEVRERLPGDGPLVLAIDVEGLEACLDGAGDAVAFTDERGRVVLRESALRVLDASGARVLASFAVLPGRVPIEVRDAGRPYPLIVDPLLSTPSWEHSPTQTGAAFGASVASAGDVDGDGHADVVVGAPHFDASQPSEGAAFVFLDSASGLSASTEIPVRCALISRTRGEDPTTRSRAAHAQVVATIPGDTLVSGGRGKTPEATVGLLFGSEGAPSPNVVTNVGGNRVADGRHPSVAPVQGSSGRRRLPAFAVATVLRT